MRNQSGIAITYVAILLIPIISIGALMLDLSEGYALKAKIKNAVDFASLAGISQLVNSSDYTAAKNISLSYLNDNLSSNIRNFTPLTLQNSRLSIQIGKYDTTTKQFTPDEASIDSNAMRIFYKHTNNTFLSNIFMITSLDVSDSSIAMKQIAGGIAPGGGFPLAINITELDNASANNNNIDLTQNGATENSYFTAFDDDNASANSIKEIIRHFKDPSSGISPPSLTINEIFQINNGSITSVYQELDDPAFIGMTFVSPVVSLNGEFSNTVTVEGFVGYKINEITKEQNIYHIKGTVIPGYIDNNWSGLIIGAGPGNIPNEDKALLANSFGLIN